jgi:hypothetical protein
MRRAHVLVAGMLTLLIARPAAPQEFQPRTSLFGQKTPAPRPPHIDWNWRPSADWSAAAKPAVVCGMTLVPADPKADPKMRKGTPHPGVTFTLRAVPPTICKAP